MATFSHASATPNPLTVILRGISIGEQIPKLDHQTDYGTLSRYIVGTRFRTAKLTLLVTTKTEHDNFLSFYRSAMLANTRFTFIADPTNAPSDTWSAFFMSEPEFERRMHPGILGEFTVEIQDVAVTL